MTIFGDDADEMFRRHHLDDATIDRLLSGRAVSGHDELVSFAEDVQMASSGTPVPSTALLAVLTEGLSHVKGDLPATAASNVTGPELQAAGLPQRRKKNMLELVLAKFGAMAVAAKLGVAAGAVTLAGTAAAATGALPADVQDFAADAAARAGIEIPQSEGRQDEERRADGGRQDAENRKDDADDLTPDDADGSADFGGTVSTGAQDQKDATVEQRKEFGGTVADSAPTATQAEEAPTADDNPGTDARSEAPAPPAPAPPVPAGPAAADGAGDVEDQEEGGAESAPAETPAGPSDASGTRRP